MAVKDPILLSVKFVEDKIKTIDNLIKNKNATVSVKFKLAEGAISSFQSELDKMKATIELKATGTSEGKGLMRVLAGIREQLDSVNKAMDATGASSFGRNIDQLNLKLQGLLDNLKTAKTALASVGGGADGKLTGGQLDASLRAANREMAKLEKFSNDLSATKEKRSLLGLDTSKIDEQLRSLEKMRSSIQQIQAGKGVDKDGKITSGITGTMEYIRGVNTLRSTLRDSEKEIRNYETSLRNSASSAGGEVRKIKALIASLENTGLRKMELGLDTKDIEGKIRALEHWESTFKRINELGGKNAYGETAATMLQKPAYKNDISDSRRLLREQEAAITAEQNRRKAEREAAREAAASARQTERERKASNSDRAQAQKDLKKYEDKLKDLKKTMSDGKNIVPNIDLSSIKQAINLYERLRAIAESFANRKSVKGTTWGETKQGLVGQISDAERAGKKGTADVQRQITEFNKAEREAARLAAQKDRLTETERRLAQAMHGTTESARTQNAALSEIKSLATQYLSIWGATNFVKEVAQITGELELQQKSLEVIIGSASKADEMFGTIREMSQMSPYTFQDLLKSTRQLAAFGIETNDLVGTMKALSDIGAGLSVDVQRLILAFGHVRSYGYLSGIQNRQFETAGIDLVGALTEHYNKLAAAEIAAGRAADYLTRKDVFTKMRKRDISFEDVNSVIMALDQPGGRFYNMQERQFDTLGGKLRNLRNNYNIMMADIGKSTHGFLTGSVGALNEVMEHWDRYAKVLAVIIPSFYAVRTAHKAMMASAFGSGGTMGNKLLSTFTQMRQDTLLQKALSSGGGFRAALGVLGGNTDLSVANERSLKQMLKKEFKAGGISRSELIGLGAFNGKLPPEIRRTALELAGVNEKMQTTLLTGTRMKKLTAKFQLSLPLLANGLRAVGAGIKAVSVSLLTMAAELAPLIAIGAVISRFFELGNAGSDFSKRIRENGANDAKEASDYLNRARENYKLKSARRSSSHQDGVRIYTDDYYGFDAEVSEKLLQNGIQEAKEKLQALSPLYDGDLYDAYKFEKQKDRLIAMINDIEEERKANQVMEAIAGSSEGAIDNTEGFWNDDIITNINEFASAMNKSLSFLDGINSDDIVKMNESFGTSFKNVDDVKAYFKEYVAGLRNARAVVKDNFAIDGVQNLLSQANEKGSKTKLTSVRYDEMFGDMKMMGSLMTETLRKHYATDKVNGANFLLKYVNDLIQSAEAVGPEVQEMIFEAFLRSTSADITAAGYGQTLQAARRKMVDAHFNKAFTGMITEDSKKEEIQKAFEDAYNETAKWGESLGIQMSDIGRGAASDFADGFRSGLNQVKPDLYAWQERLKGYFKGNFYKQFKKEIVESGDIGTLFKDTLKKKFDETSAEVTNMFPYLKKVWNIEIDPNFKINTKNLEKLKKLRDDVLNKLDAIIAENISKNPNKAKEAQEAKDLLGPKFTAQIMTLEVGKDLGFTYDEKGHKTSKGNKNADPFNDRMRERIRVIREAQKAYKDWAERIGRTAAQVRVEGDFKRMPTLAGILKDGDLSDLEHYEKALLRIMEEENAHIAKVKKGSAQYKNAQKTLTEIQTVLNEISKTGFDETAERFASEMHRVTDEFRNVWDIYKNIRASLGDSGRASALSALKVPVGLEGNPSEVYKTLLRERFSALSGMGTVDFGKVYGLDEKGLRDYVSGTLAPSDKTALEEYQKHINEIVEALKAWQDIERNMRKEGVGVLARVLGANMSLDAQRRRLDDNTRQTREGLDNYRDANGKPLGMWEKMSLMMPVAIGNEYEKYKLSAEYLNFFNNSMALTREEVNNTAEKMRGLLNILLSMGKLTPEQYMEQLGNVDKVQQEYRTSGFFGEHGPLQAFLVGGVAGLSSHYSELSSKHRREALEKPEGSKERVDLETLAENEQKLADKYDAQQKATQGVIDAFNALSQAANLVGDVFSAIGFEQGASMMADVGGLFSSTANGASALSFLGPWGAGIGAGLGLISGIAKMHDAQLERQIEYLRKDVQKQTDVLNTIKSLRQRELGYDRGSIRRELYNSATKGYMKDFYGVNGFTGSGYADELKSLEKQKSDFEKMYEKENKKKKSDSGTLQEYKTKIAELDEQIMFFGEDLAKSLWGIDLKGWADQIADAMMSAIENGENLAKAYQDVANSIVSSVIKSMAKMAIIEPFIDNLRTELFGENKVMDFDNPDESVEAVLNKLTHFFGKDGRFDTFSKNLTAFYDGAADIAKQNGVMLGTAGTSGSKSITDSVSEETAGYIAGVLAAMHQDGSIRRLQLQSIVEEHLPDIRSQLTSSNISLSNIDRSTARMVQMIEEGDGALYDRIRSIDARLDRFARGFDKISIG